MADLMLAVQNFGGEEIASQLSGHAAFSARVAGNVLALMKRELDLGPRFRAAEKARLEALLNETGSTDHRSFYVPRVTERSDKCVVVMGLKTVGCLC